MSGTANESQLTDGHVKLNFYDLPQWERHVMAVVFTVFFLMGIVGNTVILYVIRGFKPSHQYKPGRLLLIWMFGTDLGLTVLMVLPATLTSYGWKGLPSESIACTIFGYTETAFAALENLIILVMSLERSFTIYFPLRTILNVRRTIFSCITCIIAAILLSTTNLLISRFAYNPDALRCLADYYPEDRKIQLFIAGSTLLFVFVPMLTTIVVYALILRIVFRANQFGHSRASRTAVQTTLLVVGVYIISAMPFIIARLYVLGTGHETPLRYRMFATVIYMLNTAVNPYVYLATNRSLRNHGKTTLAKSVHGGGGGEVSRSASVVEVSSRAWALTRAIKNANSVTRPQPGESINKNGSSSLSSTNSLNSRTTSCKSDPRSPRLPTIEDVADQAVEARVFRNDSAVSEEGQGIGSDHTEFIQGSTVILVSSNDCSDTEK